MNGGAENAAQDFVRPFTVLTDDGVSVAGMRFGSPSAVAFVLGHGFCGTWRSVEPLARKLVERGTVYALDFRGHGASTGLTTLGNLEALDVRAVVALARRECGAGALVVTVGASMGAIAVLREAADFAGSDAVVSISAPAEWLGQTRRARVLGMLATSRLGREMARRFLSTRIDGTWMSPDAPVDLVARIRVPMVFVHGDSDRLVDPAQARLLNVAAGKRGRVRVIARYGHAEAGFDARIIDLIDREIGAHALST
jgi:alpha-beta hydrolase superfamily lysophospholipase